jgi:uncharacterized membrane protein
MKPIKRQLYGMHKTLTINAPLNQVWEVLADFNNVYTWAPSVEHSHALNDKNQQVGAGRVCSIKGFGNVSEEITQWNDHQGVEFTVSDLGPLKNTLCHFKISAEKHNQTQLDMTFDYDLKFGVFGKALHRFFMKNRLNTSLEHTLEAFKSRIETGKLLRPYSEQAIASA